MFDPASRRRQINPSIQPISSLGVPSFRHDVFTICSPLIRMWWSMLVDYTCNHCLPCHNPANKPKDGAGQHINKGHPFFNFSVLTGLTSARVTIPIQPSFFSHILIFAVHLEMPTSCHFWPSSIASPLLASVASSGQKQASASLLPGQTDHLCPGGNPTQWLWPPLLTVETRLSRLRSWGRAGFNDLMMHCKNLTALHNTAKKHCMQ